VDRGISGISIVSLMRLNHPMTRMREPVVERNKPYAESNYDTHDSHDDRSIRDEPSSPSSDGCFTVALTDTLTIALTYIL
jgi:hypothetical protein